MELFRFLLARSRRTLVLAVGLGLISGALNAGLLALTNVAISSQAKVSATILVSFVGLCLLAPLARMASEILLVILGQDAIFALRTALGRQVLTVPLRRLEQIGPSRILSVLTDDVPNIANIVGLIPLLSINIGVVVGCLGYMGWLEWRLLIAVLGFMIVGVLSYEFGVSRAARHFKRARERDNDIQKHFRGLVHGIKELKLHRRRRDAFLSQMINRTACASRSENVSGLTVYSIAASWGQLLVFVAIGLVVFFLPEGLISKTAVLTGFSLSLLYLMTPLQVIMNSVPALTRANVAIANARGLGFKLTHAEAPEENTLPSNSLSGLVQLDLCEVIYSYLQEGSVDEFTLGPVDLSMHAGEMVFITGANGSGKTTLAKLIVGLYAPNSGEIRYNGQLVDNTNRDSYRQLFSVVFSDFFLFESLLGLEPTELDERAREYLSSLRLEHKVSIKDGVLTTIDLSQGQRKRLALLTCCLEDRPIYFFDEWAAEQDPMFKEVFYLSILPGLKARGKTVIVISHDERYYGVADRIVSLESGHLIASVPNLSNGKGSTLQTETSN